MGLLDRYENKVETIKYAKQYIADNFKEKNYEFMMEHIENVCKKIDMNIIDTASVLDECARHYNHIMRNR